MRTIALNWETAHQHGQAWVSHHKLRYRMFVERQKWNIPSYHQLEYDEFDTPAATYILIVDDQNQALGAARLIPTTRPYMVETLWPQLVNVELPHLPSVWEASRFGCDRDLDARSRRRVVAQLIQGCQEFGAMNGISRYLGVMPPWIFKHVIAAHGCPVSPLGSALKLQGQDIEAAYIEVSPRALEAVRRHTGLRQTLQHVTMSSTVVQHPLSPSSTDNSLSCSPDRPAFARLS